MWEHTSFFCKEDSFLNSAEMQKKAVAQFPAVMLLLSFIPPLLINYTL